MTLRPSSGILAALVLLPAAVAGAPAQPPVPAPSAAPTPSAPAPPGRPMVQPPGDALALTVEKAVGMALERNLDLQIERVGPGIAAEGIRQTEAEFSPVFDIGGTYADNRRFLNNVLEVQAEEGLIREKIVRPESSFAGKFPAGTEYRFALSAPRIVSDHPLRLFDTSYVPMATFTLTQPLLRGLGPGINRVRIRQAAKLERQAVLAVEARMLQVIRDVEVMYWEVAYAQKRLDVAGGSLTLADDLAARLRRLKGAGMATALDVSQAEVMAGSRRADVVRAGADLKNAQAKLRALIDPDLPVGAAIVALEPPPDEPAPENLQEKVDRALVYRPELLMQTSVIENLRLEERLARSNARWRLDAVGGASYGGLAGHDIGPNVFGPLPGDLDERMSYGDAFEDGAASWSLGLKLEIPLGKRDALAGVVTARDRLRQEELRLALYRAQITVEVETAFQDMGADRVRLDAARAAVEHARLQVDAETRNLEAGRGTARRVLESHDMLADAQKLEQRALADFAAARSRLIAAQALGFEMYRMEITQ